MAVSTQLQLLDDDSTQVFQLGLFVGVPTVITGGKLVT